MKVTLNIYIVNRTTHNYDEYDGFVVAAKSDKDALEMLDEEYNATDTWSPWPNEGEKAANLIGTTDKYDEPIIILGSFNAG